MKMTRKDVVLMYNALTALSNTAKGEFAYAVVKNLKNMEAEISAISKLEPAQPARVVEYETKRKELIDRYALKDESGAFVIKNNMYMLNPETKDEFNKAHDELTALYNDDIKQYQASITEYNEKDLAVETEINVYFILKDNLPADIGTQEISALSKIIEGF